MDSAFSFALAAVAAGSLASSLSALWRGSTSQISENPVQRLMTWRGWLYPLFFILPFTFGAFARGSLPVAPWRAFEQGLRNGSVLDATGNVLLVVLSLLWFFVVPARIYWKQHPDEQEKRRLVLGFNLTFGFLAISKGNAFAQALFWFFRQWQQAINELGYGF